MNSSRSAFLGLCLVVFFLLLAEHANCKRKRHPGGAKTHGNQHPSARKRSGRQSHHSKRNRKLHTTTVHEEGNIMSTQAFSSIRNTSTQALFSTDAEIMITESSDFGVINASSSFVTPVTECIDCVVIDTTTGMVRGKVVEVLSGKSVNKFLGIKYGEAPVGKMRFKEPKPVASWKGVRDAFEYGNSCYQWKDYSFDSYKTGFRGTREWNPNTPLSEDCLYLNIWTPTSAKDKKSGLAVLVWIFGGAFYSGTASLDVYDGKWLAATQNVVVVSMNYRVAALGFLAAGRDDLPGNAALFDQRLGLQWVQKNIENFGGDPGRVTVFGESSGAVCITMHMASPLSKGLFSNAILQSASSLSPWSVLTVKEARRRSSKLAKALDCTFTKPKVKTSFGKDLPPHMDINITCMQHVSAQKLINVEIELEDYGTASFPNAVVVDNNFLRVHPKEALEKGDAWGSKVNVLAGFNLNEGTYFLVYGSHGFSLSSKSKIGPKGFRAGIRRTLKNKIFFDYVSADNVMVTSAQYAYTNGNKPAKRRGRIDEDWMPFEFPLRTGASSPAQQPDIFYRNLLDDLVGDFNFVCPTVEYLDKSLVQHKPGKSSQRLYLYKFAHRSSQNHWPKWMGVMHGYEIHFVFGIPLDESLNYTHRERNLTLYMMRQWANFAKYGNPNGNVSSLGPESEWPIYTNRTKYVNVMGEPLKQVLQTKASLLSPSYALHHSRCSYWRDVFPELKRNLESIGCDVRTSGSRSDFGGFATIASSSLLLNVAGLLASLPFMQAF